jgi:2-polyprenyl-3-methyl-5-hydroxy-6-metoxy-1,4-benzoquinol methylase
MESRRRRLADHALERYARTRIAVKRLVARLRPGERAQASMFFDAFPRFYETTQTSAAYGRLNLRYEAIFAQNADIFAGARVLDIACHDGRWSLAALRTGAAAVIGVEAREDLVEAARHNLDLYAAGKRYDFRAGDIFEVLADETFDVDVVLCLGFLYHTLRYNELMRRIRDLDPGYLIVDTAVQRKRGYFVHLRTEREQEARSAVTDRFSHKDMTIVGRPSVRALRLLVETYGFELERLSDWDMLIRDNPALEHVTDYATGRRVTARCVATG